MAELGNVQQLKGMLQRLGAGEDLASVREDFVKSFKDVPVKDIMAAEQELIKDGADPRKITKLCDLHSALFHGKTEGEVIREQKRMKKQDLLQLPEGHPVDYFIRENSALELILNNLQMALENGGHDDKVQRSVTVSPARARSCGASTMRSRRRWAGSPAAFREQAQRS